MCLFYECCHDNLIVILTMQFSFLSGVLALSPPRSPLASILAPPQDQRHRGKPRLPNTPLEDI
ncbi:hypothetical protein BDW72DRAFT_180507 [Aspergillus terricola var. indicus]